MRVFRCCALAGIPCAVLVAAFWSTSSFVSLIVWVLTMAVVATYVEASPCPRCGMSFFRAGAFHNLLAKACLHCGLPKWEQPQEMGDQRTIAPR